jgi:hypothetical protein
MQGKARQGKARQGKARQAGKRKQGRQEKARQGSKVNACSITEHINNGGTLLLCFMSV